MLQLLLNQPGLSFKDNRIYRIANLLMILAIIVVGSTGIYLLTIGGIIPFWICLGEVGVFIVLLYWHTHGKPALARYIFFLFSICMTVVGSLVHGEAGGFDYLFLVTALSPVLFFNKRWQYASLFFISMATYLIVKSLYAEIPPFMPVEKGVVPYYLNIIISALLIYFGYGIFKTAHLEHEKQLKEQNKTILLQKEDLNQVKEQLEQILKIRTAKIEEQNSDFLKYAFLNSHKARSPLARLLGLLNLTPYEDFSNEKKRSFYFNQIRENAEELDDILKEISLMLNKHIEEE